MAKWLNLHPSNYNLSIEEYFTIAMRQNDPYKSMFIRRFNKEVVEIAESKGMKPTEI